jgi:C4-dicarboxylate-specific signal transduction histidine kinase
MNLVMNAIRAVSDQPEENRWIGLETAQRDGRVQLVVEDSGCGIPEDVALRMFEPFFTTKALGIGMGLAISRRIVEAHGGRIWAEHREAGGVRVSVRLPPAGEGRQADA